MKRLIVVTALLSLSACSHVNVGNEWDCPRQSGFGCIKIATADEMAVTKLEPLEATPIVKPGALGKKQKIWFAPYIDGDGNHHEASIVYLPE
ncbi:MAG: TraV family lipoprotein [Verrucomicrobia bacterium]|nr:TraV family lipoprotein [Verrucomicrobiota bacterium]